VVDRTSRAGYLKWRFDKSDLNVLIEWLMKGTLPGHDFLEAG